MDELIGWIFPEPIIWFLYLYIMLSLITCFKLFSRRWASSWFVTAGSWWTSRTRLILLLVTHRRQALLLEHLSARLRAHTQCTTRQLAHAPRWLQLCSDPWAKLGFKNWGGLFKNKQHLHKLLLVKLKRGKTVFITISIHTLAEYERDW